MNASELAQIKEALLDVLCELQELDDYLTPRLVQKLEDAVAIISNEEY